MDYTQFLSKLSKPAQRALLQEGITSFEKLASLTEKELLSLHGVGPKSIPIVTQCLQNVGMSLREE